MAHTTPYVASGLLTCAACSEPIPVESAAWWQWLNETTNTTFRFLDQEGDFTARSEWKHGGRYWYAYRKRNKKLHKAYLGRSTELVLARLKSVAQQLMEQSAIAVSPQLHQAMASADLATAVAAPLPQPLLATKMFVPPPRSDVVERPHLLTRLEMGRQRKLTLLSAPAGFGKSTLLSAWCADGMPRFTSAWLTLDSSDNDPARFWRYIVATLRTVLPALKMQSLDFQELPAPATEAFLTTLINLLSTVQQSLVLILDDYHCITAQEIHTALTFLLDHLPTQLHLVLASRNDPPLPLVRWRARGQLNELRTADLRFSGEEVDSFLRHVMGLSLTSEEVAELDAHTEGWVAGLQLAGLSMQGQQVSSFIAAFTGSHRYILDYLTGEVLDRQSEAVRTFLLQTSILERLSAPLCDFVTQREDSAALLEWLERANLFLIPLDEPRHWYRYHHLFAEFLQSHLKQKMPEMVSDLHRRASFWYEQQGLLSATVKHAFAASDMEHTAQIVEQFARTMLMRGEVTTLLYWIGGIPEEILQQHLQLQFYYAGALITIGQLEQAEIYLQRGEEALAKMKQQSPADPTLREREGELAGARATLAAFLGDLPGAIEYGQRAIQLLPQENTFVLSVVQAGLGTVHLFRGEIFEARDAYAQAITFGLAAQNSHAVLASMACQGYLEFAQGHLHQAAAIYEQTIRLGTREGGRLFSVVSIIYVLYGMLWYEWNDLDRAERYARDGIELGRNWGYIGMLAHGYMVLALVQYARGQFDKALACIEQAEELVNAYTQPYVTFMIAAYKARIQLLVGNLAPALQWAQGVERPEKSSYNYEDERLVVAEIRLVSGEDACAHTLLEQLHDRAVAKKHTQAVITCLILQALYHMRLDEQKQARLTLVEALKLAEPEGYIRTFIDRGEAMLTLLRDIAVRKNRGVSLKYVDILLEAAGEHLPAEALSQNALLSEREIAVLQRIAAGRSNQQIAQDFTVAISTIKTHVHSIYTKLDVHSRTQAIARAKKAGLLS